jgi:5-methyltetrahydropteroyltriglutamate--homocysteine methyltransferase
MKRSTQRILTSHAGNLPRPEDLWGMILAKDSGQPVEEAAFQRRVSAAVVESVRRQVASGIDIVNDGEQSKRSWQTYAVSRLSGIEVRPARSEDGPIAQTAQSITAREMREFPEYFQRGPVPGGAPPASALLGVARAGVAGGLSQPAFCVGPVGYIGQAQVETDIANLKAALQGVEAAEGVLTAIAPGTIEHWLHNQYYKNDEEFLFAIAAAMATEYKAIADAGFLLQIDDPDLPDAWQIHADMTVAEYRKFAELRVEALNHALRGIPPESVRLHICWGSIHHPHKMDIPLRDIVDIVLKVNAGVYSVEAANPRHDHEWEVWKDAKVPEGKALMPGVVGHYCDFIEHPELVAQRLVRYASVVGRENVIAGTDCGLGGRVGHEKLVWAKFEAMAEGARIATRQLWRKLRRR